MFPSLKTIFRSILPIETEVGSSRRLAVNEELQSEKAGGLQGRQKLLQAIDFYTFYLPTAKTFFLSGILLMSHFFFTFVNK